MSPKRSQRTLAREASSDPQEETPLLHDINTTGSAPRSETPLPITQVTILFLLQLCEPIASQSIKPYINQVRLSIHTISAIGNDHFSLSVSSQSLVVTRERSDTTQG